MDRYALTKAMRDHGISATPAFRFRELRPVRPAIATLLLACVLLAGCATSSGGATRTIEYTVPVLEYDE